MPKDHPFQRYWAVDTTVDKSGVDIPSVDIDRKAYQREWARKKRAASNLQE